MNKQKEYIKGSLRENIKLMNTPLMSILPGQIALFVILSLIPLLSILMMLISKLSFSVTFITSFIINYVPDGIGNIILSILDSQRAGAFDIFFIITAFYLASKATHSIVVASTQVYGGKQTNFVRTRIKAITILMVLVVLIIFMVGILMGGSYLVNYLKDVVGGIHPFIYWFYTIIKWPATFFMVFYTIKVIYTIAPNVSIPSYSVNKGALLTTVVWILSTFAYSFYVSRMANYTKFYGNLSSIIILMIWVYWLSYIFVFGMTLNEYKMHNEK